MAANISPCIAIPSSSRIAGMLPDFAELKAELAKFVYARLNNKMRSRDPVLRGIRRFTQHEGRATVYEQMPSHNKVEMQFQAFSTQISVQFSEVPSLVGERLERKLDEIVDGIVPQMARSFFEQVGDSCDKVGNTVHANGQPLSPELLLEMVEKVQMEFDPNGNPTTTFVFHPDMFKSFEAVAEKIENDPELKRRNDEILRRQREAWAARESNRKLVD